MIEPDFTRTRFSKTGQPVLGTTFALPDSRPDHDGEMFDVRVVAKLWGHKGSADLIGVIVEDIELGGRTTLSWPLEPI